MRKDLKKIIFISKQKVKKGKKAKNYKKKVKGNQKGKRQKG